MPFLSPSIFFVLTTCTLPIVHCLIGTRGILSRTIQGESGSQISGSERCKFRDIFTIPSWEGSALVFATWNCGCAWVFTWTSLPEREPSGAIPLGIGWPDGRDPPILIYHYSYGSQVHLYFNFISKLCNKAGGEIVDAMMKVVGIKLKYRDGKVTHTQYVRVNLQDFEHPFFGRVWHGVHVLDGTSPLLTNVARQMINANGGSWPENWFASPIKIRKKLDFQGLVRGIIDTTP